LRFQLPTLQLTKLHSKLDCPPVMEQMHRIKEDETTIQKLQLQLKKDQATILSLTQVQAKPSEADRRGSDQRRFRTHFGSRQKRIKPQSGASRRFKANFRSRQKRIKPQSRASISRTVSGTNIKLSVVAKRCQN